MFGFQRSCCLETLSALMGFAGQQADMLPGVTEGCARPIYVPTRAGVPERVKGEGKLEREGEKEGEVEKQPGRDRVKARERADCLCLDASSTSSSSDLDEG